MIAGAPEVWIDVGGTFTDCILRGADGTLRSHKLLSTGVYKGVCAAGLNSTCIVDPLRRADPANFYCGWSIRIRAVNEAGGERPTIEHQARVLAFDPLSATLELDRRITVLDLAGCAYELFCPIPAPVVGIRWLLGLPLDRPIGSIQVRLGTTRGTNALLEKTGAATAFVTTAGFGDVLRIGVQARPRLFDLNIRKAAELYCAAAEIRERVAADGSVLTPLDRGQAREELLRLRERGVISLAICLLNSYRNPAHEIALGEIARECGFEHVSLSTQLSPLQRMVPRAETTVVDAYLQPVLRDYIASIRAAMPEATLQLMTSGGGLSPAEKFAARDSVLSGPAGGVVGVAAVAGRFEMDAATPSRAREEAGSEAGEEGTRFLTGAARQDSGAVRKNACAVIGFDMGGTSTDVCRYAGEFERRYEMSIVDRATDASIRIAAPMLSIEAVAAGGGSICGFDGVKPTVGPQSAGADPGPACYGRGGPLCITDVNVHLGRTPAEHFPFPLDRDAIERRLDELIERIAGATVRRYSRDELALGYVRIVTAQMAAAIRRVSIERGHDPREHALVCFGGAGGQHACELARNLGIRRVVWPPLAGLLSAYGIGRARPAVFASREIGARLDPAGLERVRAVFDAMSEELRQELTPRIGAGAEVDPPILRLELRYRGQDTPITVTQPTSGGWRAAFEAEHVKQYGFAFSGREIEIVSARAELHAAPELDCAIRIHHASAGSAARNAAATARVATASGWADVPVIARAELRKETLWGPLLICDESSSLLVEAGCVLRAGDEGAVIVEFGHGSVEAPRACAWGSDAAPSVALASASGSDCEAESKGDPIELELFHRQFAGIAEEMGATLQRTALSTNVKERLDFSCAVFDADGDLVAHAPHIPVHLGAMSHCVKCLIADLAADGGETATDSRGGMRPGEVYVTNDPYRGGSHMPDVTVVTPVFDESARRINFFVASRAHHAEIGGITPGSMPPKSRTLADEGVLIRALRLRFEVRADGTPTIDETRLRAVLSGGPHPSRDVERNVADILAQVAANRRGVAGLESLARQHGAARVLQYMKLIQQAAETKCRAALRRIGDGEFRFSDALDDGTPVCVRICVCAGSAKYNFAGTADDAGSAKFNFAGTGPVHAGNLNATPAIVASAVLYCLRCLIGEEIPLNAGVLRPVTIEIPRGCLLNPPRCENAEECAAVVGGNVETSQRVVDVIFGALDVVAASQGTMNNLTFGIATDVASGLRPGRSPENRAKNGSQAESCAEGSPSADSSNAVTRTVIQQSGVSRATVEAELGRYGLNAGAPVVGGSYYETICGGAGAGPGFDGADAVHTHMTNTRLTDPEVLEDRYPVRLREFRIRRGSGGAGTFRGGDGVVREIEFLSPMHVSILSQRRVRRPYGLNGGTEGAAGRNTLLRISGEEIDLGSCGNADLNPGDRIRIETPGGGGFGEMQK